MSATQKLRIATRRSKLALWQAEHVAALLRRAHPSVEVLILPLTTQGDRIQDRSLATIGGKGLFIKELEVALQDKRADMAVHSMKDVPAEIHSEFEIGAVLERADARDALVARNGIDGFDSLPHGARVGTSSLRRQAQLLAARPDLRIEMLRGNIDTRLRLLDLGNLDAILLACAGLIRLGLESRISVCLDTTLCLPAVGQGVIGIECRKADDSTRMLLQSLENTTSRQTLDAERAFAAGVAGSCQSPIAAYAELSQECLTLHALVAEPDGSRVLRDSITGGAAQGISLGKRLATRMLAAGAGVLLDQLRAN